MAPKSGSDRALRRTRRPEADVDLRAVLRLERKSATVPTSRLFWAAWSALAALTAVDASAQQIGAHAGGDTSFPIGFQWERAPGAETCIGEDALRRAAEALLQHRPFAPIEQTAVSIRGRVAPMRNPRRYQARLSLVVGDGSTVGERTIESDSADCASLTQPLSLVIATAVDSLRALPKTTLHLDKRERARWFAEVGPAAFSEWGLLPAPTLGIGLDVALHPPSFWAIDLGIIAWPFPTRAGGVDGPGARLVAVGARLGLCPTLADAAPVGLRLCFDVQGGRFMANGVSVDISRSPTNWTFGLEGRVAVPFALGRGVALEPSVGAFIPFVQYRFTYTDQTGQDQEVYSSRPVALMLELAVPLRIP
jgi:hypothetical protein